MPRKKNPTGVRDKTGVASITYAAKRKNIPPAGLFARADAARRPASETPPGARSSPGALVASGTTAETNAAGQPAAERGGGGPDGDGATRGTGGTDWFAAFYGGLRGTVKIAPGTDLTAPIAEEWDAERDR